MVEMVEGLTVIAVGLLVVLCIILTMFAFIEVILKFDQVSRNRTERARKREQARKEQAAPAPEPEASLRRDELMAAIGFALHQHLTRGRARRSAAATPSSAPTPWVSSGRLGIMTERQRTTSRRG
jgi:Na+-transporting methylmalonyl-CoA/oxaloacetate decarboxylase gamma subunit